MVPKLLTSNHKGGKLQGFRSMQ